MYYYGREVIKHERSIHEKKVLILICSLIVSFLVVGKTTAFAGSEVIFYSDDYFSGDSDAANTLAYYFTSAGYSISFQQRPNIVYAINTVLQNANSLYISTHGTDAGSKLVLSSSTYYTTSDVTSKVKADFVYFSACYSSKRNTTTQTNLCSTVISNGAEAAIGYNAAVGVDASRYFEKMFYKKFVSGGSNVYTAYNYAVAQTKNYYGSSSTTAAAAEFFGNGGYVLD